VSPVDGVAEHRHTLTAQPLPVVPLEPRLACRGKGHLQNAPEFTPAVRASDVGDGPVFGRAIQCPGAIRLYALGVVHVFHYRVLQTPPIGRILPPLAGACEIRSGPVTGESCCLGAGHVWKRAQIAQCVIGDFRQHLLLSLRSRRRFGDDYRFSGRRKIRGPRLQLIECLERKGSGSLGFQNLNRISAELLAELYRFYPPRARFIVIVASQSS